MSVQSYLMAAVVSTSPLLLPVIITDISYKDPIVYNAEVGVLIKTSIVDQPLVQYKTCVTSVQNEICSDNIIEFGTVKTLSFTVNVPTSDILEKNYFTTCVVVTSEIGSSIPSAETCESESVEGTTGEKGGKEDSYFNQGNNFSLYNNGQTDGVAMVSTFQSTLSIATDGSLELVGEGDTSTDFPLVNLSRKALEVYSTRTSLAVLDEGNVLTLWGNDISGGIVAIPNVNRVFHNTSAFVYELFSGEIKAIGVNSLGGNIDANTNEYIEKIIDEGGELETINGNHGAFAALFILPNGLKRIVTWGRAASGGILPKSLSSSSDILNIVSSQGSFSMLNHKGDVITWGGIQTSIEGKKIVDIVATRHAYAGITDTGNVVTWGDTNYGGSIDAASTIDFIEENTITSLCKTDSAFLALSEDTMGVAVWGNDINGGVLPLEMTNDLMEYTVTDKTTCRSTESSFLLSDGSNYFLWGEIRERWGADLPSNLSTVVANNTSMLFVLNNEMHSAIGDPKDGGCIPNASTCLSSDDSSLDLETESNTMLKDNMMGSFHNFDENENEVKSGFFLIDDNKALLWGSTVIDRVEIK